MLLGTKQCVLRSFHLTSSEELREFLSDLFEIRVVRGIEVENFSCVSQSTLEDYFGGHISSAKESNDGLDRLWNIYNSATLEISKTLFIMFNSLSPAFVLNALRPSGDQGNELWTLKSQAGFFKGNCVFGMHQSRSALISSSISYVHLFVLVRPAKVSKPRNFWL